MSETSKGLMFRPEMVRAILEGRKTQTRRTMKRQPIASSGSLSDIRAVTEAKAIRVPHPVGSEIWVKEKARVSALRDHCEAPTIDVIYAADGFEISHPYLGEDTSWFPEQSRNLDGSMRWGSSMFMPRWAARIFLRVTDVRVQRLQEITEEDAKAEGVAVPDFGNSEYDAGTDWTWRYGYATLWESINGPGSWDANPWVWCFSFERKA